MRSSRSCRLIVVVATLLTSGASISADWAAPPVPVLSRVALVPLDDRPINLQDVVLIGRLGGVEVVTPPRSRLGRLDAEGDADGIAEWIDGLKPGELQALIVSIDMVAYGGYRASRRPDVTADKAIARLQSIGRVKARGKSVRIYAFVTLLGMALADDGHKGAWKSALLRWAELGGDMPVSASAASEIKSLESQLPSSMLDRYRAARARNLAVVMAASDLLNSGAIDALVVSSEGPSAPGVVAREKEAVTSALRGHTADRQAVFVTGSDQVAALLLARTIAVSPRRVDLEFVPEPPIAVRAAVDEALAVADASPVQRPVRGDPSCVVYTGRGEAAAARSAAERIGARLASGVSVSLADVAETPETGASIPLVEALRVKHAFQHLSGFAGGEMRTTVARATASALVARSEPALRSAREQGLLHSLAVDFVYASVVRPQAADDYFALHRIDPAHLDVDQLRRTQAYLTEQVKPLVENLIGDVSEPRHLKPGPSAVRDLTDFTLRLPWGRLDEVEISFGLSAP